MIYKFSICPSTEIEGYRLSKIEIFLTYIGNQQVIEILFFLILPSISTVG